MDSTPERPMPRITMVADDRSSIFALVLLKFVDGDWGFDASSVHESIEIPRECFDEINLGPIPALTNVGEEVSVYRFAELLSGLHALIHHPTEGPKAIVALPEIFWPHMMHEANTKLQAAGIEPVTKEQTITYWHKKLWEVREAGRL